MSDSFVTPGTVACRLLCPWDFQCKNYWSGLPCPSPGDLPNPGIEPTSPALAIRFFTTEPLGKPSSVHVCLNVPSLQQHQLYWIKAHPCDLVHCHYLLKDPVSMYSHIWGTRDQDFNMRVWGMGETFQPIKAPSPWILCLPGSASRLHPSGIQKFFSSSDLDLWNMKLIMAWLQMNLNPELSMSPGI